MDDCRSGKEGWADWRLAWLVGEVWLGMELDGIGFRRTTFYYISVVLFSGK